MLAFEGKTALITGGSRGIGAAVARTLAAKGAHVALTYKQEAEKADKVVASIEQNSEQSVSAFQMDISDGPSVKAAVAKIVGSLGQIDILVNNAGTFGSRSFDDIDFEFYADQFNTNVWGIIQVTQAVLPHITAPGGRIVNLSSQRAYSPKDGTGACFGNSRTGISVNPGQ